jgi:hypothetical protein
MEEEPMIPADDLTPKERQLKSYLEHLVNAHDTTDLRGCPWCADCATYKEALK